MFESTTTVVGHQAFGNIGSGSNAFISFPQDHVSADNRWASSYINTTGLDVEKSNVEELEAEKPNSKVSPDSIDTNATELNAKELGAAKPETSKIQAAESNATGPGAVGHETMALDVASLDVMKPYVAEPDNSQEPQHTEPKATISVDEVEIRDQSRWTDHKEQTIRGPYDYISSQPGKEFRTQLLSALNLWHKVSPKSLACISNVIRMLHNASLLVDDIQDNSTLRRGRPVAHNVFGVAQTINSANFIYFLALKELQELRHPKKAIDIFTTEMLALHRGQGMDLFWRDTLSCPTEDDYLEMASNKTGGLFRLAVRLMQAESDMGIDCMPFINILGLIFQITDDYKNLADLDYSQKKGYCEDLTEGKFSFPVIHSIHAKPANPMLLNIIAQKTTEFEVKRQAVEYMESTGSFSYTRQVVDELVAKAKAIAMNLDAQCGNKNKTTVSLVEKIAQI
ncbi:geranylgeranyl pyrophosphate synthetase [Conoideocrella luteorostrata]|uniref:Geranylgeranyl pyrophosphate synthetase n=1 Tax=Conoideocrella luteorostrata TaxID=1105319 RepID=A0AAJ0FS15_9HYPO|nr:geranylgeranyl pyrophosphate synthetase [Conoideocrella luteorostrata]